jgi:hypothetical protein
LKRTLSCRWPAGIVEPNITLSTASAGDRTTAALTVPEPEWTSDSDEELVRHLRYDVDVDGDGRPDRLEAEESRGSGGGMNRPGFSGDSNA